MAQRKDARADEQSDAVYEEHEDERDHDGTRKRFTRVAHAASDGTRSIPAGIAPQHDCSGKTSKQVMVRRCEVRVCHVNNAKKKGVT